MLYSDSVCVTETESDIQSGLSPCFSAQSHPAPTCGFLPRGPPEPVQASESCTEKRELTSEVES